MTTRRKPYSQELKGMWWKSNFDQTMYIIRELSSVAILVYGLFLLWGLVAHSLNPIYYALWSATMMSLPFKVIHVVIFALCAYHTYTWFSMSPMVVRLFMRGKKIPNALIGGTLWVGFVLASLFLIFILRG